jgi:hypothetical protein
MTSADLRKRPCGGGMKGLIPRSGFCRFAGIAKFAKEGDLPALSNKGKCGCRTMVCARL